MQRATSSLHGLLLLNQSMAHSHAFSLMRDGALEGGTMNFFRLQLLATLLLGITLISAVSTYFEVLAHKHAMRKDLEQRTLWLGTGLQLEIEQLLATDTQIDWSNALRRLHPHPDQPTLAIFDDAGYLIASIGNMPSMNEALAKLLVRSRRSGKEESIFVGIHNSERIQKEDSTSQVHSLWHIFPSSHLWHECAFPLRVGERMVGTLVILSDADSVRIEGIRVWKRSFLRITVIVLAVAGITLLMVQWLLQKPVRRAADWLRRLRHGETNLEDGSKDFKLFLPLAREVTLLAENMKQARTAAETEARLREDAERIWTADRLAVHAREHLGKGKIFVVSNREPYMHVRQKSETQCVVPPSGVVTAIEPILQACDGTWIAHGSGSEDASFVDEQDRLRVPPDESLYTLRRVWLDADEIAGYYEGFSNEGLWPLCHIAHTRPIFRASDWAIYQNVNHKFAEVILEEIRDVEHPVILVQDYHFALLPSLIKQARPEARIAIFWHIPWPNAEAFGICPWQAELLDGLLGADIIGFHLRVHCSNFLSTIDHVLEAKTNWEMYSIQRHQHISKVRPYPISVAWNDFHPAPSSLQLQQKKKSLSLVKPHLLQVIPRSHELEQEQHQTSLYSEKVNILHKLGIQCDHLLLGVDRMDYTKGIVERMLALEHLLELHPQYVERVAFLQIASPSRSQISSYIRLREQVEETVDRINRRFQTSDWSPIHLIQRQCSHPEIERYYRIADVCVVTALHDGMNLVAKEYLAARHDDDGVLILSHFAGAAHELHDALLVNPYDIEQVSNAICRGLEMEPEEREVRMKRMRHQVRENNVYRWASEILTDLCAVRIEDDFLQANLGRKFAR